MDMAKAWLCMAAAFTFKALGWKDRPGPGPERGSSTSFRLSSWCGGSRPNWNCCWN